jgi:hypothetical protein
MNNDTKTKRVRTASVIQSEIDALSAGLRGSLLKLSNATLDAYRSDISKLISGEGSVTSPMFDEILELMECVRGTQLALATTQHILRTIDKVKEQVKANGDTIQTELPITTQDGR